MADQSDTSNLHDNPAAQLHELERMMRSILKEPQRTVQDADQNPKPHHPAQKVQQPQTKQTWTETECSRNACQGQTKCSNANNANVSHHIPVVIEPNELKLMIKLNTWIADNGNLMIQPSLVDDRDLPSACVCIGGQSAGDSCLVEKPQQPTGKKNAVKQRTQQQLGNSQGQQRQQKPPWQQQQQLQEAVSKPGDIQLDFTNVRSVNRVGASVDGVSGGSGGGVSGCGGRGSGVIDSKASRRTKAANCAPVQKNNHQENENSDESELFNAVNTNVNDEEEDSLSNDDDSSSVSTGGGSGCGPRHSQKQRRGGGRYRQQYAPAAAKGHPQPQPPTQNFCGK